MFAPSEYERRKSEPPENHVEYVILELINTWRRITNTLTKNELRSKDCVHWRERIILFFIWCLLLACVKMLIFPKHTL